MRLVLCLCPLLLNSCLVILKAPPPVVAPSESPDQSGALKFWMESLTMSARRPESLTLSATMFNQEITNEYAISYRLHRKISENFSIILNDWKSIQGGPDLVIEEVVGEGSFELELRANPGYPDESLLITKTELNLENPCPDTYVLVKGSVDNGIEPFCVAKYEMSGTVSGAVSSSTALPSNLSRNSSITACRANGDGYDLISNLQWQSLAWDVESVAENWSSFTIPSVDRNVSGRLAGGIMPGSGATGKRSAGSDSDPCIYTIASPCSLEDWNLYKRTHFLSSGEIIWDLAGNNAEYVKDTDPRIHGSNSQIALVTDQSHLEDTRFLYGSQLDLSHVLTSSPYGNLGSALWHYVPGTPGTIRGGWWGEGGIYRTNLTYGTSSNSALGFRCVYTP